MVQMVKVMLKVIEICALYKFLIHNIRFMGKKLGYNCLQAVSYLMVAVHKQNKQTKKVLQKHSGGKKLLTPENPQKSQRNDSNIK